MLSCSRILLACFQGWSGKDGHLERAFCLNVLSQKIGLEAIPARDSSLCETKTDLAHHGFSHRNCLMSQKLNLLAVLRENQLCFISGNFDTGTFQQGEMIDILFSSLETTTYCVFTSVGVYQPALLSRLSSYTSSCSIGSIMTANPWRW